MPAQIYHVVLNDDEKYAIGIFLQMERNCKENLLRAKILLELDESGGRLPVPVSQVALQHGIAENSVRRIRKRYALEGIGGTLKHYYNPLRKQHNQIVTPKIQNRILYYHFQQKNKGQKYTAEKIAREITKERLVQSISDETVRRCICRIKKIPDFYNVLKWLHYKERFETMEEFLLLPMAIKGLLYRDERYKERLHHIPEDDYYRLIAKLYDDTFFHSGKHIFHLLKGNNYVEWSFRMWKQENTFVEKRMAEYIIDELVEL